MREREGGTSPRSTFFALFPSSFFWLWFVIPFEVVVVVVPVFVFVLRSDVFGERGERREGEERGRGRGNTSDHPSASTSTSTSTSTSLFGRVLILHLSSSHLRSIHRPFFSLLSLLSAQSDGVGMCEVGGSSVMAWYGIIMFFSHFHLGFCFFLFFLFSPPFPFPFDLCRDDYDCDGESDAK